MRERCLPLLDQPPRSAAHLIPWSVPYAKRVLPARPMLVAEPDLAAPTEELAQSTFVAAACWSARQAIGTSDAVAWYLRVQLA